MSSNYSSLLQEHHTVVELLETLMNISMELGCSGKPGYLVYHFAISSGKIVSFTKDSSFSEASSIKSKFFHDECCYLSILQSHAQC